VSPVVYKRRGKKQQSSVESHLVANVVVARVGALERMANVELGDPETEAAGLQGGQSRRANMSISKAVNYMYNQIHNINSVFVCCRAHTEGLCLTKEAIKLRTLHSGI
jgi:hypothetical protein